MTSMNNNANNNVNNSFGLFYQNMNNSSQSFQQPNYSFKHDGQRTSSYTDLFDLQTQLETQKKLREGAEKLLKTTENEIANGKYDRDPQQRRAKRLEAQFELNKVNRNIVTLQRKIEASKRIQAQEANNSNNLSSSFSYIKSNDNNSRFLDESSLQPPDQIQNIVFTSAHNSSNTTPILPDNYHHHHHHSHDDNDLRFEDENVLRREQLGKDPEEPPLMVSEGSTTWILSDILQALGQKNEEEEFYIQKSNQLVDLLKNNPELVNNLVFSTLGHRIQFLLLSTSKEVIACGYRIARYVITDIQSLRLIKSLRVHFFLILSLTGSSEFTVEREQAIKLIRRYFDIDRGYEELSVGVVKTLAIIVTSTDDELKDLITETLCELLLLNPKLVYEANGIKPILKIISEGPPEMASMCGLIITKVLDLPESRKYLRNGEELGQIINYFANNFTSLPDKMVSDQLDKSAMKPKTHLSVERLHNNAFIISSFLKTWIGLSAFAVNDFQILKILIACLAYNIPILRDVLMDIFFDILKIRPLPWLNGTSANHKRISQIVPSNNSTNQTLNVSNINQVSVVNHYTSVLLAVLLKCGLVEQVLEIAQTSADDINRRKSLYLLTEMFNYAVSLLPQSLWEPYFEICALRDNSLVLISGTQTAQSAAFQFEKMTRKLYKNRTTYNISPKIFDSYLKYNQTVASYVSSNIDDMQLKKMIDETKVLFTKRFIDWKWDIILEIIKGPLKIPKKFDDCLKYQFKFLKKMLSFYRPFKKKFLLIKKSKNYQKYINTGVALFEMLLSHQEGTRYLAENKLLPQIAECLAQVDPVSGLYAENPIFSRYNLETTLSSGYFKMLGVLSKSQTGLKLLRKWKLFSIFLHLINERGREDLILTFLPEFDFTFPSQLRVIFAHALTSCDTSVRLFATEHLSKVLSESKNKSCSKWATNLLVNQLYDPDMEICNVAVQILDKSCLEPEHIMEVVKYRPSLDQLGNIGAPLLLRFLSTPLGFNYLLEIDFIEKEMRDWFTRKNYLYVLEIENLLNDEYSPFKQHPQNGAGLNNRSNSVVVAAAAAAAAAVSQNNNSALGAGADRKLIPHHFYGELVKTQSGISLLQSTNHFHIFVDTIKELANESSDESKLLRLKGCLWSVGHIGSSELAISMVDESGIMQDIIEICKNTEVWSVKGTAFFVLGLLSNTAEGLEILDEYDWDVALDVNNNPTNFCLPKKLEDYFQVRGILTSALGDDLVSATKKNEKILPELSLENGKGKKHQSLLSSDSSLSTSSELLHRAEYQVYKDTPEPRLSNSIDLKIIHFISNFGITSSSSIKHLTKLESKYKERFTGPDLYLAVMYMLENYSYKQSARSFILQLFSDKKALENLIKKDRYKLRHA